jgi:hypothetical protein
MKRYSYYSIYIPSQQQLNSYTGSSKHCCKFTQDITMAKYYEIEINVNARGPQLDVLFWLCGVHAIRLSQPCSFCPSSSGFIPSVAGNLVLYLVILSHNQKQDWKWPQTLWRQSLRFAFFRGIIVLFNNYHMWWLKHCGEGIMAQGSSFKYLNVEAWHACKIVTLPELRFHGAWSSNFMTKSNCTITLKLTAYSIQCTQQRGDHPHPKGANTFTLPICQHRSQFSLTRGRASWCNSATLVFFCRTMHRDYIVLIASSMPSIARYTLSTSNWKLNRMESRLDGIQARTCIADSMSTT